MTSIFGTRWQNCSWSTFLLRIRCRLFLRAQSVRASTGWMLLLEDFFNRDRRKEWENDILFSLIWFPTCRERTEIYDRILLRLSAFPWHLTCSTSFGLRIQKSASLSRLLSLKKWTILNLSAGAEAKVFLIDWICAQGHRIERREEQQHDCFLSSFYWPDSYGGIKCQIYTGF